MTMDVLDKIGKQMHNELPSEIMGTSTVRRRQSGTHSENMLPSRSKLGRNLNQEYQRQHYIKRDRQGQMANSEQ